jgi:hypothetical protein
MRPNRRRRAVLVVDPTDWDADLAAEGARLREANVMRFGRRAAAYDAGLLGDEFAVLFVAPPDCFRRDAAALYNARFRSGLLGSVDRSALRVRGLLAHPVDSLRPGCV